jgi:hypothetical protein
MQVSKSDLEELLNELNEKEIELAYSFLYWRKNKDLSHRDPYAHFNSLLPKETEQNDIPNETLDLSWGGILKEDYLDLSWKNGLSELKDTHTSKDLIKESLAIRAKV